ncbi:CPBP family intramembrane metalloprotease, partial [Candidatus Saccharibacteria bacterium]|nr:CPBP family intramembrane metalloprotease [Candidatus Saccharibacteria bacterium]
MSKDLSSIRKNYAILSGVALGSAGLFFISQILAVLVLVIVLKLLGNSGGEIENLLEANSLVQLVLVTMVASLSVFLVLKILKYLHEKPKKFLLLENKPTLKNLKDIAITYAGYFLTLVVVVVIINIINATFFPNAPLIDTEQAQDLGVQGASGWGLVPVFLMLVVIPPIYEEIIFRGFLFNMLRKKGSLIVSGILTSVMFGAAHLEFNNLNWIAAIDTLIFSGF